MGKARIEIFARSNKHAQYPGAAGYPIQVEEETSSTSATTAGSRKVVAAAGNYNQLYARVTHDEACYVAVGADPTASNTALGYLLSANVPLEIPVKAGDKFSFKELA